MYCVSCFTQPTNIVTVKEHNSPRMVFLLSTVMLCKLLPNQRVYQVFRLREKLFCLLYSKVYHTIIPK